MLFFIMNCYHGLKHFNETKNIVFFIKFKGSSNQCQISLIFKTVIFRLFINHFIWLILPAFHAQHQCLARPSTRSRNAATSTAEIKGVSGATSANTSTLSTFPNPSPNGFPILFSLTCQTLNILPSIPTRLSLNSSAITSENRNTLRPSQLSGRICSKSVKNFRKSPPRPQLPLSTEWTAKKQRRQTYWGKSKGCFTCLDETPTKSNTPCMTLLSWAWSSW